jgi:hypothetical protein
LGLKMDLACFAMANSQCRFRELRVPRRALLRDGQGSMMGER